MIPVGHLAPRGCWDENIVNLLLDGGLWPHGLDVKHFDGYPTNVDGCVLVLPGRYWVDRVQDINTAISRYRWVLVFKTSDEESLFDLAGLDHPNVKTWCQTPLTTQDHGDSRLFGVGFPPHFNELPCAAPDKTLELFLSAQNTHERRAECFNALTGLPDAVARVVEQTAGFTQGMSVGEYTGLMVSAKIAPCPSGAVSPDSFRVWEALEAHAIPIADDISPTYDSAGYWRKIFGGEPAFPVLTDYTNLLGWVLDAVNGWPTNANRITAWWMRRKRQYALDLVEDLKALGAL